MDEKTLSFALEVTNTVTITNEEYANLQRRSAALDIIFALHDADRYGAREYVETIKNALTPVITAEEADVEDDEDAE